MPRTPAVYEAKAKWRLKFEEGQYATEEWSPAKLWLGQAAAGISRGKGGGGPQDRADGGDDVKEAKERFGSRLLIGAMGIIEEGKDKFRLIHGGTHTVC